MVGPSPGPDQELALLCASVDARRRSAGPRVEQLLAEVDFDLLVATLTQHGLLELVGSRLADVWPDRLPPRFQTWVDTAVAKQRYLSLLHQSLTLSLTQDLEAGGIPVLPVKGSLLGEAIHGDPAVRPSSDIDLLVAPQDLERAAQLVERHGYRSAAVPRTVGGLPEIHLTLLPERVGYPPVELHWRIHWFDTGFSARALARSRRDAKRGRVLRLADELCMLALFFARDGFVGLKYPADIAAWWDRYAARVGEAPLDPALEAHPELRSSLLAASVMLERLVGLEAERLHSPRWRRNLRSRSATRLANWPADGTLEQLVADMSLIDWLLTPRHGQRAFLRRHLAVTHAYGLGEHSGAGRPLAIVRHDAIGLIKLVYRYARRLRWLRSRLRVSA